MNLKIFSLAEKVLYYCLKNRTTYLVKQLPDGPEEGPETNGFVKLEIDDLEDIRCWCDIVNSSYSDAHYTIDAAKEILTNHSAVANTETVFYEIDGKRVATISYGNTRGKELTGSFFRIAVLPSYRNRGLGSKMLSFAEEKMHSKGCKKIEEGIRLKRTTSLIMHFKHGYIPDDDYSRRINARKEKSSLLCGF